MLRNAIKTASYHLPATQSFQARFAHAAAPKNHYAILIDGGRIGRPSDSVMGSLPETTSYASVSYACKTLIGQFCQPEKLTVHFGTGENPPKTFIDPYLWMRCYNYFTQQAVIVDTHQALPAEVKPADQASIEETFNCLSTEVKAGDVLFIHLSGHGNKFGGVALWNEYVTLNMLGPAFLAELMDKINPQATIILTVASCKSGSFLSIMRPNLVVLTDANLNRAAWYKLQTHSSFLAQTLHYLTSPDCQHLLLQHAAGSLADGNYYSADTLTQYIENKLREYLPQGWVFNAYDQYKKMMAYVLGSRSSMLQRQAASLAFLAFCISLPTESVLYQCISEYLNLKFGMTMMQTSPLFFKIAMATFFQGAYDTLRNKLKQNTFYQRYPTTTDRLLLNFSEKLCSHDHSKEAQAYLQVHKVELLHVLARLRELHDANMTTPVISKYHFLFDKAVLFILIALKNQQFEAIAEFIQVAKRVIDPLQKGRAQDAALANACSLLKKHSIFALAYSPQSTAPAPLSDIKNRPT